MQKCGPPLAVAVPRRPGTAPENPSLNPIRLPADKAEAFSLQFASHTHPQASKGAAVTRAGQVAVVGGGVAGLVCARMLHAAGVHVTLLEAGDGVGGRVRTDLVDGFPARSRVPNSPLRLPGGQAGARLRGARPAAVRAGGLMFSRRKAATRSPTPGAGRYGRWQRRCAAWAVSPINSKSLGCVASARADSPEGLFQAPERQTDQTLRGRVRLLARHDPTASCDRSSAACSSTATCSPPTGCSISSSRCSAAATPYCPALGMGAISRQLADGLPPDTVATEYAGRRGRPESRRHGLRRANRSDRRGDRDRRRRRRAAVRRGGDGSALERVGLSVFRRRRATHHRADAAAQRRAGGAGR